MMVDFTLDDYDGDRIMMVTFSVYLLKKIVNNIFFTTALHTAAQVCYLHFLLIPGLSLDKSTLPVIYLFFSCDKV